MDKAKHAFKLILDYVINFSPDQQWKGFEIYFVNEIKFKHNSIHACFTNSN